MRELLQNRKRFDVRNRLVSFIRFNEEKQTFE
jgi:hypothetical protein